MQGICPGNRLKLLPTSYDSGCFTPSPMSSPCPSSIGTTSIYTSGGSTAGSASMSSGSSAYVLPNDLYENTSQKHSKRRSWHIMPNKVRYIYIYMLIWRNKSIFLIKHNQSLQQKSLPIPMYILRLYVWTAIRNAITLNCIPITRCSLSFQHIYMTTGWDISVFLYSNICVCYVVQNDFFFKYTSCTKVVLIKRKVTWRFTPEVPQNTDKKFITQKKYI